MHAFMVGWRYCVGNRVFFAPLLLFISPEIGFATHRRPYPRRPHDVDSAHGVFRSRHPRGARHQAPPGRPPAAPDLSARGCLRHCRDAARRGCLQDSAHRERQPRAKGVERQAAPQRSSQQAARSTIGVARETCPRCGVRPQRAPPSHSATLTTYRWVSAKACRLVCIPFPGGSLTKLGAPNLVSQL
jgi:hypothetical protein